MKNIKVLSFEDCVPQHKLLVCDFVMKMTKHAPVILRLRGWKLKEPELRAEFERVCNVKLDALDVTYGDVSTIRNHLKKSLLEKPGGGMMKSKN